MATEKNSPKDKNAAKESKDLKTVTEAHKQADKDIEKDPDLSMHSPNDDLDEGELARLDHDKNEII